MDLYFGNFNDDVQKYFGLSIVKENIDNIYKNIFDLNIIKNINKINFYLGLEVEKRYKFILTGNIELLDSLKINKNKGDNIGLLNDMIIKKIFK